LTNQKYNEGTPNQQIAAQKRYDKREQFVNTLIHQFTDALTAVIGYSELALHQIETRHPAREWLEKVQDQAKSLMALMRQLIELNSSVPTVADDEL